MVGWHHQLNGHEFEQTPGDSGGQGILVCCSPWGHKESDMTEQLNNNNPTFEKLPWIPVRQRGGAHLGPGSCFGKSAKILCGSCVYSLAL